MFLQVSDTFDVQIGCDVVKVQFIFLHLSLAITTYNKGSNNIEYPKFV